MAGSYPPAEHSVTDEVHDIERIDRCSLLGTLALLYQEDG